MIVRPETVIGWHRQGFRLYGRWKSHPPAGRPSVPGEVAELLGRISLANQGWGAPRIAGELLKLGLQVSQRWRKTGSGTGSRRRRSGLQHRYERRAA